MTIENSTSISPEPGSNAEFGAALDAATTPVTSTPEVTHSEQAESHGEPVKQQDSSPEPNQTAQHNNRNAQRRIQQKREYRNMQSRVKELEARLAGYEGKDDPDSNAARESIGDRLDDIRALNADNEYHDFHSRAVDTFGEQAAQQFMKHTEKYARYVNQHEPELCAYIDRPLGQVLLSEWYKRMDRPDLRQEWLGMTQFEKGRTLDTFYKSIDKMTQAQPAKPNVPVPGSGRNTNGVVPDDDFGLALSAIENRHRRR